MTTVVKAVEAYLRQQASQTITIWVAYSGGLDSHVLLHALNHLKDTAPIRIKAIHINHQLQDQAASWADHCQSICQAMAINCTVVSVDATASSRQSPEDAARQARYEAFANHIPDGDILLTAHHQTDQTETLLLQLQRGAGLVGLAAMPEFKINAKFRHDRPLLFCPKQDILNYAQEMQLNWIDDPSNENIEIRRNFIRHEILPKLREMWPQTEQTIAKSVVYLADALELQESLLDELLPKVLITKDSIALDKLSQLPEIQQRHCLRHWYQSLGIPRPADSLLTQIKTDVINAQSDAQPKLQFAGSQLLRTKKSLVLLPDWSMPTHETLIVSEHINLQRDAFTMQLEIDETLKSCKVSIVLGDYSVTIDLRGQPRALKKYYKEVGLPMNLRGVLPLVFVDDELKLIPGLYEHDSLSGLTYSFDLKRLTKAEKPLISEIFG